MPETAQTASDRLYAKIAEKIQSSKPGLKSSSATVTEIAGTVIVVLQDVVFQPDAISVILNKPIKDKLKSYVRASGVEFDVEKFPTKSGKAGDVSVKFDKAKPKQLADALGVLRRIFDTAISYGKSPAPLEATAAESDLKTQAIGSIKTSLTRMIERARNMYEAIAVLADQESKSNTLVELPMKLKYEIAKCYESYSSVESLIFRQLLQDKAVIEVSYKNLSKEDAKAIAEIFVPMYRNRKLVAFRGSLFTVAAAFGTSKPRVFGDLKKLAVSLRPACDDIEATVANASVSSEATASSSPLDTLVFPKSLCGMERGSINSYRDRKYVSYYSGTTGKPTQRKMNISGDLRDSGESNIRLDLYGLPGNHTLSYENQKPNLLGTTTVEFGATEEETMGAVERAMRDLLLTHNNAGATRHIPHVAGRGHSPTPVPRGTTINGLPHFSNSGAKYK